MNRMEIFNEVTVLICTSHLFLFTDFVPDPLIQYQIGWSMLAFTGLNIIGNLAIIGCQTVISIVPAVKMLLHKCKRKVKTNIVKKVKRQSIVNIYKESMVTNNT